MLILLLYKQIFNQRILPDTQKGPYIKMRRPAQQDIKIINAYASNNSCKICEAKTGWKKRKRKSHNSSWKLQHLLSITERISRHKVIKDIAEFNNTIIQDDVINIYKTHTEYTFSSSYHKAHIKPDNALSQK